MNISKEQYNKYKDMDENGFKVNINSLRYSFYPKFQKDIFKENNKIVRITITFTKNDNSKYYSIEVVEHEDIGNGMIMSNTSKLFNKTYFKNFTKKRFSINELKDLCNNFENIVTTEKILKDYFDFLKSKK